MRLYGRRAEVDVEGDPIPFGRARIAREGSDVTVVALSSMVDEALAAADRLAEDGISVEVIDPRTLAPLDMETILGSLRKTMRLAVAHDAHRTLGFGAEIAARCMEEAFDYLDAPVERVACTDVPIPCTPSGIEAVYPVRRRRRRRRPAPHRMTALLVPQLSISMEEAKVSRWLVDDGDPVSAGQIVVEVETDKATVEIEAPEAGLLRIVAEEGAIVAVDGVLAEVEAAGRNRVGAVPGGRGGACPLRRRRTPRLPRAATARSPPRRLAASREEQGVELAHVQGTGPGGRIVARDVAAAPAAAAPPAGDRLRAAVVANIAASWQQIPHVHVGGELAADGIVRARASAPPDPGVTVTDLLVVALARALAEVPELNALRRADGTVERSEAVHLSLAVATANGVVAPVIRDAGSLSLAEVARERGRLVEAARAGALDGRELAGGTITLSNLGAHPVDFFAPVVSGPQVAMVATGRVADRPVAVDGLVGVRPTMWVNVAIDHRAADGEAGGRLLAALERRLAQLPGGTA